MGGLLAKPNKNEKQIEKQLERDKQELMAEIKLLLLGPGESGKSTLTKQMKLIHLNGFTNAERQQFRDICHTNVISIIKTLVTAVRTFNYKLDKSVEKAAKVIEECDVSQELDDELAVKIRKLWRDSKVQKAFARYAEFQLGDSAKYYLDSVDRLSSADYVPTDQDILRVRAKTTGITEICFQVDDTKFRVLDVGGQRSERKKWMHCFEGVQAIVFVCAISEYDLMLYEDTSVRRMDESLQLFDEICNSEMFADKPMILYLNKSDLFREKLARVDLSVCFPDYKGGDDYERAIEFCKSTFEDLNKNPQTKRVYTHTTCATDTENVSFVFSAVKTILLQEAITDTGL